MTYREGRFTTDNPEGTHEIVYSDWGNENDPIIIGVHGLTGNGSDFDYLAPTLVADGYRVIAVDLPGRGRSNFLPNPMDYNYHQYTQDLYALLNHLGTSEVDWIGISLGGLLGIKIAGAENSPIKRLIINDVGPTVPKEALDFIHMVISQTYTFESIDALEKRMRETRGLSWGPVTDEQWAHMAKHNARELPDGQYTYAYDPAIAKVFETEPVGDTDLWPLWDDIKCPVLLLQGAQSLILPSGLIEDMKTRGPKFDLHVFKDCGHVPSLMAPEQIEVIREWLKV